MSEEERYADDPELNERIKRAVNEKIEVVPYDAAWPALFEDERKHLLALFGAEQLLRIEHFGSTAVAGLDAKPVIDMLVEVPSLEETKQIVVPKLESLGYDYFWRPTSGNDGPPFYCWFIKRDRESMGRTHHIHMVEKSFVGHWDRLYFRDYLREFSEVAEEYALLKRKLSSSSADRVAYTEGKSAFVLRVTDLAKRHYLRSS